MNSSARLDVAVRRSFKKTEKGVQEMQNGIVVQPKRRRHRLPRYEDTYPEGKDVLLKKVWDLYSKIGMIQPIAVELKISFQVIKRLIPMAVEKYAPPGFEPPTPPPLTKESQADRYPGGREAFYAKLLELISAGIKSSQAVKMIDLPAEVVKHHYIVVYKRYWAKTIARTLDSPFGQTNPTDEGALRLQNFWTRMVRAVNTQLESETCDA